MVRINGQEVMAEGKTVSEYLSSAGFDIKRVAVERNGDIIPRAEYDDEVFEEGDTVEIVNFVGGG